ncbi:hypothetical protein FQA39_LY08123 [Lamprigera yunnana]|nr:hypothetical protein FQA39_LY08123 [Lamprigera yunnana]
MFSVLQTLDMDVFQKIFWLKASPYLLLLVLEFLFEVTETATQREINNHLELGKQFLARGQLADALTHYHAAIEGSPGNYLTYFQRGTVYLALGKAKSALSDMDQVLQLKPDFRAARVSRGNLHLKLANYDLAQLDFYNVLQQDPHNLEASELIHRIQPATEHKDMSDLYYSRGDFVNAIALLSEVINISPWAAHLFELRAQMHLENEDLLSAIADIKAATKLQSDNTEGFLTLSTLLYQLGHAADSLKSIRECLKLDPEHKKCFAFYKKIKKVDKHIADAERFIEENNFKDCVNSAEKILNVEKEIKMIMYEGKRLLCKCYVKDELTSEAIHACSEALELNSDVSVYCDKADAYIQGELYDDAIREFKLALERDQNYDRAKEGIERAKKLQHQAERRDYYKILEVKRSASKKEIIKAYRKMAQKWHPDNYQNDEKMKKIAEKKFIDIAAAKEVLTNEEKRKQFDNGEDPLDPESGRMNMPNFQHFQGFHGSPFQFRFHFN